MYKEIILSNCRKLTMTFRKVIYIIIRMSNLYDMVLRCRFETISPEAKNTEAAP